MASLRRRFLVVSGCLFCLGIFALTAMAQDKNEVKIPEPEDIERESRDGVFLMMTYFPGTMGKNSAPIILLHGWDGQRGDMQPLALKLQSLGHACLTLDLRGHGESNKYKKVEMGAVVRKDLPERDKFQKGDVEGMANDIEAAKKFLIEKNNLGECNIEALGIVACDISCLVAMRWSVADWNAQNLPTFKQGQDVKALVLLSPVSSYKGVQAGDFVTNPQTRKLISVMLVAGKEDGKYLSEIKRLNSKLQQVHYKPTGKAEEDRVSQDLFLIDPPTELQGSKLLTRALPIANNIANFFNLRLVEKQETYKWGERKSPLAGN